jgi:hypothetical protein
MMITHLRTDCQRGVPVRDRTHARGIKRGHIWTYLGDGGEVAFCEYTPDWKGAWPQATLADFRGQVIQSGGYGASSKHSRPETPGATMVVSVLRAIYAVEAQARADGVDLDELRHRRQRDSRPLVERVHRLIGDLAGRATPKSPLGMAVAYAVNQWSTLVLFLDDPRVPLSNAHVERQQRRTAIGRKKSCSQDPTRARGASRFCIP